MIPSSCQVASRIPALDGLRGLAIFLVVFGHYAGFKPDQSWPSAVIHVIFPLTWTGVDLFFVLSGFLIGGILIENRGKDNYFRTFYLRRICRIFPLYFFWLALFFSLTWLLFPFHTQVWYGWLFAWDFSKVPWWSYTFFLQNIFLAKTYLVGSYWITITWSLAVEEQFYLSLPILIWLVPARKLVLALTPLILFAPAFRLFLFLHHTEIYPYCLLSCHLDALLIGVLCAYYIRHERVRRCLEENQDRLYLALGILLLGVVYLTAYASSPYSFEMLFLGYTWMALFYACLLLIAVTAKKGIFINLMNFPPLRKLGIIAYGVFLMHVAINILMHGLISGKDQYITNSLDGIVTLMAFLITLLLATLSWRFFERPIINWGHSFSYTGGNIRRAK